MRDKIRLVSSAGTGHFYTTDKNKKTMPEKMEIKKFDPKVRMNGQFFAPAKTELPPSMTVVCRGAMTLHGGNL